MNRIMLKSFLAVVSALVGAEAAAGETDYTQGILIVNEDWYGHQNSTVNFLVPDDPDGDYWHYRVIQEENPGKELGCTNQYGAVWGDRLYLIAKQEKDPGATITGGRITVADARTLKILHQQSEIDPSGAQCDGRGFVGVDAHKGYVSSSNGIWIFDLDRWKVRPIPMQEGATTDPTPIRPARFITASRERWWPPQAASSPPISNMDCS